MIARRTAAGLCGLLLLGAAGCAGDPPASTATDLYLVEVSRADGRLALGAPENLTDSDAWDNQPAFLPDGGGFLYSVRRDGQADIHRYDLAARSSERLTDSIEREYSPRPIPGDEGFSAIRVEQDERRRLWRFDARGQAPALLFEWVDEASYYAWIDPELLVLYVEGEPSQLHFADVTRGWADPVPLAEDVGRTVRFVAERNAISFVQKLTEDEWWIVEFDLLFYQQKRLVPTLPGQEDFEWLPSGELLMAKGSRVYAWTPGSATGWEQVADYESAGLPEITRIEADPLGEKLILVSERPGPVED